MSPGQLNFSNNLTWVAGANIKFDLGLNADNSDFVSIAGNLLKSGTGSFSFTFVNNGWILGQTYDLISFNSTGFSISDFSYTNGGQFGGSFAFSGGNLLQFTLTSIPEPSALLVLVGGLGAALIRRRKVV